MWFWFRACGKKGTWKLKHGSSTPQPGTTAHGRTYNGWWSSTRFSEEFNAIWKKSVKLSGIAIYNTNTITHWIGFNFNFVFLRRLRYMLCYWATLSCLLPAGNQDQSLGIQTGWLILRWFGAREYEGEEPIPGYSVEEWRDVGIDMMFGSETTLTFTEGPGY